MKTATGLRFSTVRRAFRAGLVIAVLALAGLVFYPRAQPNPASTEGSEHALPPGLHQLHHFDTLA